MTGPLAGVRVLDFTWVGAGSLTTKLLADHGADVLKIESSVHIDSLRLNPPFAGGVRGPNRSGYFAERNSNKRSVCLNLREAQGQALARRLAADCDIVANNFRPGVMERFGLGYEDIRQIRPDVIYLAMSMQGSAGPEREYLGYGLTIGALVGLQHLTGLPDRYPVGTGTNYPDHVPNPCHAAFAVLAALRHRRRTGEGQCIDIAQTEPTIATIGTTVLDYTVNGVVREREGNGHPQWAPHGLYRCAGDDRWIAIAVRSDAEWLALADVLGLDAERYARNRHEHAAELDELVQRGTSGRDAVDLAARLQQRGVAAGPVQNSADLVDTDPQLAHRGHWVSLRHPEMGTSRYGMPPFRLSATPGELRTAAPVLGAHTREVLTEVLGMGETELDTLDAAGVLR
ncbi:MAG TPA: CoA transferase [Pseudonocardiaceae bacterium]|jgi:benzylsuccinate CoA-transferase BbsF subunit